MAGKPARSEGAAFSGWVVGTLLAVSGLAFILLLALVGWSPELRDRDRAGLHAYSTSALGYQGLYRLLEASGTPVTVSRSLRPLEDEYEALKIVTLETTGQARELDDLDLAAPMLIVLPKWEGFADPDRLSWFEETQLLPETVVAGHLRVFDSDADIWRLRTPRSIETPFGLFKPRFGDDLQVMRADSLVAIVETPGGVILGRLPDRDVYFLSDPDLVNTFGLAEPENARMALAMIDWLSWSENSPVMMDAALHGFERSENLLQMVFDAPFFGVTLTMMATFLMIGWAGAVRFGAPLREERAIALGKQALADSTAGLVAMGRRERHLAPGYLSLIRRSAAKAVGAPKTLSEDELSALFDRIGPKDEPFSQLEKNLSQPAASREDLMDKARRLWRWHKEITHGHK